ncbi:MAG: TRAP transporter substrate-binding protein DctP [Gemmobacter sp.]|jgi:TRAP-type transport system periplasmic protein|nr:TRAP transporter substrate-binding protein DctP [Gemmobacter sp.]
MWTLRDRCATAVAAGVIGTIILAAPVAQAQSLAEQWLDGTLPYSGPAITYSGPPIEARFSHFLGPSTPLTIVTERAIERLKAESNGKLNISMFYNNSLHDSQRGGFEGVAGGISQISTCYSWINPGGFTLQLGLQLPFLFERSTVGSHAIMQLYGEYFKKDYEAKGVLFARSTLTPPQQLLTRGNPIKSLADLAGKRMMASGTIPTDITTAFGAVPVPLTVAEYYSGFQQGVIDVMVLHDAGLKQFRMAELAKARTVTNLWANPIEYCMNADFVNSLPADLKELFLLWMQRLNHAEAELYFDGYSSIGRADLAAAGVTTVELPEAEMAAFKAAASPVVEAWIAKQEAEGRPARKFLADLTAKVAELDALSDDELFKLSWDKLYPGLYD